MGQGGPFGSLTRASAHRGRTVLPLGTRQTDGASDGSRCKSLLRASSSGYPGRVHAGGVPGHWLGSDGPGCRYGQEALLERQENLRAPDVMIDSRLLTPRIRLRASMKL